MSVKQSTQATMLVAESLNDEDLKLLIKNITKYSRKSFPLEDFLEICQQVRCAGEMKKAEYIELIYRRRMILAQAPRFRDKFLARNFLGFWCQDGNIAN
ncbi:hypothetical protein TNCV_1015711 [Trichonephila clavipes]|uniref:Uncharacterized protein n=1 Tax=Trichonephila clavipes TaxID=2585209 RepID=A0A8X7B9U6_TRICX|nr:hypothetical protein TNCV_1015711 [Trichonephila clavipes]